MDYTAADEATLRAMAAAWAEAEDDEGGRAAPPPAATAAVCGGGRDENSTIPRQQRRVRGDSPPSERKRQPAAVALALSAPEKPLDCWLPASMAAAVKVERGDDEAPADGGAIALLKAQVGQAHTTPVQLLGHAQCCTACVSISGVVGRVFCVRRSERRARSCAAAARQRRPSTAAR